MRISDWSSDVCSSDLLAAGAGPLFRAGRTQPRLSAPAGRGGTLRRAHHPVQPHRRPDLRLARSPGADGMRGAALVLGGMLLAALVGPLFLAWPHDVIDWNAISAGMGAPGHLLGTDNVGRDLLARTLRSAEHTSELQSLMRTSYAVFCLQ